MKARYVLSAVDFRHGGAVLGLGTINSREFERRDETPAFVAERKRERRTSKSERRTRSASGSEWRCGSGGQPVRCGPRPGFAGPAPASPLGRRPPVCSETGATAGRPRRQRDRRSTRRLVSRDCRRARACRRRADSVAGKHPADSPSCCRSGTPSSPSPQQGHGQVGGLRRPTAGHLRWRRQCDGTTPANARPAGRRREPRPAADKP